MQDIWRATSLQITTMVSSRGFILIVSLPGVRSTAQRANPLSYDGCVTGKGRSARA